MSFIPEVKVDFIPSDDEEEIIEEKYEEAEKLKVSFESESESEEEEEEIKQEIFTKPEPKKKEPNLTKSGKPRKQRPPMSEAHKEKLKFAREKAMAVRKKNAEERKQMKSVDKEEKELLKKQKIKRVKKLKEEVEEDEGKLITFLRNRGLSTFAIALIALGVTDLVFALDSIPAILGLTTSTYVVITANIFALMGLRQLYFLLQGAMDRLIHLGRGLSFILAFIGVKMILHALHENGVHVVDISLEVSLTVIVSTLAITALTSLYATRTLEKPGKG